MADESYFQNKKDPLVRLLGHDHGGDHKKYPISLALLKFTMDCLRMWKIVKARNHRLT